MTKSRLVHHLIYFTNKNDQNSFLESIKDMSFKIKYLISNEDEKNRPYGVKVSRTDSVDRQSVYDYTMQLFESAREHNGVYDGWETSVVQN